MWKQHIDTLGYFKANFEELNIHKNAADTAQSNANYWNPFKIINKNSCTFYTVLLSECFLKGFLEPDEALHTMNFSGVWVN